MWASAPTDWYDQNTSASVAAELADDYLFSNKDFISQLSTENRNVFQKVWDEIKYLCKVATAGSKEARELARIEKMFGEVYRESGEAKNTTPKGGVKYSLMALRKILLRKSLKVKLLASITKYM